METSHLPRPVAPSRGDIWLVKLDPVTGLEQGGTRPALIISADQFNRSAAQLVVVAPMTTVAKGIPWHIQVNPPDGRVRETCYIKCEDIRSISTRRLVRHWGTISIHTMDRVTDILRILLEL